jgi:hypothetical protein
VGLVVKGVAVADGTWNPATKELFLGALDFGVPYNDKLVPADRGSGACRHNLDFVA